MTQFSSDFRPCLACQMPEFDHGDGSPTDHPYDPDLEWRPAEEELAGAVQQEAAAVHLANRFTVEGKDVLWDGQQFIETVEPEAAQGLVEMLNEVLRLDYESRLRVRAKVRRDRIRLLSELIANPSKRIDRYPVEAPEHWAARAVMSEVDRWL